LAKQGGIGLNMPMPPSKIKKHEIMRNLNQRKKVQICKAYLINAMEDFLSSVVNTAFADEMSAEFVVRIDPFDLGHQSIANSVTHCSLFMYPLNAEKYNISENFIDCDGAVSMEMITRHVLASLNKGRKKPNELAPTGFTTKTTVYVFDILHKDGVKALNEKIDEIQNLLRLNNATEYGNGHFDKNSESDNKLIKFMIKIIEEIDSKAFLSEEFQEIKTRLLCEK